jgi:hypothetical protein
MKRFFLFVFLITLLFLQGCSSLPKGENLSSPKILEPSTNIKFADIPIPSGFKPLLHDSYSFQTSNVRVAVLKYSGRPDAERVFLFFKEQMPLYGWNLLNTIEYGRRLLNFEKENESCIITIEPKKLSTEFIISLGPKQTILKKEQTPIK